MSVNIGGNQEDKSYRYKMPQLQTKIEGRGNGIKTVIVNMVEIAKALHVDPAYPTKYFGYELGAQSTFGDRAIVNGQHTAADLSKLLEKFVETFVLCPKCRLPEITLGVKKGELIVDCAACGRNANLNTAHRLKQFILKAPPGKKVKETASKDSRKKKQSKKGKKGEVDVDKEEAEEKTQSTKFVAKDAETEWFSDTSKEAQKRRKEAEFENVVNDGQKLVDEILSSAKSDNKTESPVTTLKVFLAARERAVDEILSELRRLQLSRGLDDSQRIKTLLEALIDTSSAAEVPNQFKKYAPLLRKLAADKNSALLLLTCIEELVGVIDKKLLPRVPVILQTLYENDVIEEETLLLWHSSPPESSWLVNKKVATTVRERAKPFIDWLKEAEEE